jgi:hypothetical protein
VVALTRTDHIIIFATFGFGLLCLTDQPRAEAGPFDGTWGVTVVCGGDPNSGAQGYRYDFAAQVINGVLHGEHGVQGRPSWLAIDGRVNPDGTAYLSAVGLTGEPRTTVGYVHQGTPYAYHVNARFDGARGSGSRIELRPCSYVFVKQ